MCCRQQLSRYRKAVAVLILASSFSSVTATATQEVPGADRARMGQEALSKKDYDRAWSIFSEGRAAARQSGDRRLESDFLFYMALTKQQQAKAPGNEQKAPDLLQEAANHYLRALALRPDAGSAMNNLAEVYSALGRNDEASKYFQAAVNLQDSRNSFYAKNYADHLARTGESSQALDYYKVVQQRQPENAAVHQGVLQLYLRDDRADPGAYLWQLLAGGSVRLAPESALSLLVTGKSEARAREEFLTVVAVGLSRQYYQPPAFPESPLAGKLRELSSDVAIGPGAVGILQLHQGENLEPAQYRWWAQRGQPRNTKEGVSPREGFRMLVRSLGDRYQESKDVRRAESYYLLAAHLDPRAPDPEALVGLAELYVAQNRLGELRRISEQYIPGLFAEKGAAYEASQPPEKIYKYHRALGVLYSHLGRWGDKDTPGSAIFQLERARAAALGVDRERPTGGGSPPRPDQIKLEPRLVDLLAEAYTKTNQPASSYKVRIDAAEHYVKKGDSEGARQVLEPIREKAPPPGVTARERDRGIRVMETVRKPPPGN